MKANQTGGKFQNPIYSLFLNRYGEYVRNEQNVSDNRVS